MESNTTRIYDRPLLPLPDPAKTMRDMVKTERTSPDYLNKSLWMHSHITWSPSHCWDV